MCLHFEAVLAGNKKNHPPAKCLPAADLPMNEHGGQNKLK